MIDVPGQVVAVSAEPASSGEARETRARAARLPQLATKESLGKRMMFGGMVAVVAILYLVALHRYWVPGHSGTDQNGYLVGAKQFARTLSMGVTPPDEYSFVGKMWIWAKDRGQYFPKYPLGLPFLYAVALWIGGASHGVDFVYWVNPLAMALAVIGTYLLMRAVVGVFPSILGVIVVASSPVALELANNPNSHAATLCAAVWGMWFLFRWWKTGNLWWARAAGLFVGYAATIRYTEGLLVIPLVIVALMNVKWRDWKSWREAGVLLLWWAIPIGILVTFNVCWFGHLTGYDPTNESTGFSLEYFQDNWETMVRTLYNSGLFFVLPFAIAGLVGMYWWNWRVALVLTSWIAPSVLLYTAYYWAPESQGTSYIRFFLTVLPPLALAGVWGMSRVIPVASEGHSSAHVGAIVATGIVVAIGAGVAANSATPALEAEQARMWSTVMAAEQVKEKAPEGSFIFADGNVLHHLQFVGDYRCYSPEPFTKASMKMIERGGSDPDRPTPFQFDRAQTLLALQKNESEYRLIKHQNFLMSLAGTLDQRVFFVGTRRQVEEMRRRFVTPGMFVSHIVDVWSDVPGPEGKSRKFDKFRRMGGWDRAMPSGYVQPATEWAIMEITRKKAGVVDVAQESRGAMDLMGKEHRHRDR